MKVSVIGAGTMGSGIAQVAATNGHEVCLFDSFDGAIKNAETKLNKILNRLVEKERISDQDKNDILSRIKFSKNLDDIKTCLKENDIENFELKIVYSPTWTTDWMTETTKEKLKKYGIAPPSETVICPQCDSAKTKLISEFGATACKSLYKCKDCLEPFEHFKCI